MVSEVAVKRAFSRAKDAEALDRAFRLLSKRLHPDSGGTDEDFILLKREYDSARMALERGEGGADGRSGGQAATRPATDGGSTGSGGVEFDPTLLAEELGYPGNLEPRAMLYVCLRRYRMVGLYQRRIRADASLKKRNSIILATLRHWARICDPVFAERFFSTLQDAPRGMGSTEYQRFEAIARDRLWRGFEHFLAWQEEGRPVSERLAREWLGEVVHLVNGYDLARKGDLALAEWLLGELDKPRVSFG